MAENVIAAGFIENIRVVFVGILIYAVIYALLKKIKVFGDGDKVSALIALMAAIIVSFSGVVTYAISYAINWFIIIFFIVFLLVVLLLFLGVDFSNISGVVKNPSTARAIVIAFGILFAIVLIKSFFALNNSVDTSNPQNNSYVIDTSFNTGIDDITGVEVKSDQNYLDKLDNDLLAAVLFLVAIGIFVFIIGA